MNELYLKSSNLVDNILLVYLMFLIRHLFNLIFLFRYFTVNDIFIHTLLFYLIFGKDWLSITYFFQMTSPFNFTCRLLNLFFFFHLFIFLLQQLLGTIHIFLLLALFINILQIHLFGLLEIVNLDLLIMFKSSLGLFYDAGVRCGSEWFRRCEFSVLFTVVFGHIIL